MVELALIALTVGAVLFHTIGLSLLAIAIVSLFFGAIFFLYVQSRKGFLVSALLALVISIGALTVWSREYVVVHDLFGERTFEGVVISTDRKLDRTILVVNDTVYNEHIRITRFQEFAVLPGDVLSISGAVEQPQDFLGNTGRIFAYQEYLESKGIVAAMQNPDITVIKKGTAGLTRSATAIRYALADIFTHVVSFPTDGIVAGMLLGYQGGIPMGVQDLFRTTGVLHVLVLSGYNITLLAGFLGILLRGLPQRVRIIVSFLAVIGLVLISGSGVASVRAGVMGSIALFATLSLENYNALRALCVSYILFFFWSPTTIFADPGFHLSFLATLCMIVVIPKVEGLFSFIPKTNHIDVRAILMLAVVMPFFMLPYTMYFSGVAPFATVPANILLALLTPLILFLGIAIISMSMIVPVASVLGTVLSFIGAGTLQLLALCARLPLYNIPYLPWWSVVGIYTIFFIFLFRTELSRFTERLQSALQRQTSS